MDTQALRYLLFTKRISYLFLVFIVLIYLIAFFWSDIFAYLYPDMDEENVTVPQNVRYVVALFTLMMGVILGYMLSLRIRNFKIEESQARLQSEREVALSLESGEKILWEAVPNKNDHRPFIHRSEFVLGFAILFMGLVIVFANILGGHDTSLRSFVAGVLFGVFFIFFGSLNVGHFLRGFPEGYKYVRYVLTDRRMIIHNWGPNPIPLRYKDIRKIKAKSSGRVIIKHKKGFRGFYVKNVLEMLEHMRKISGQVNPNIKFKMDGEALG